MSGERAKPNRSPIVAPTTTIASRPPLAVWAAGIALSALVIGPGLGPGSLLNLDLVLVSDPPIPPGVWGLGPELPRRVPMWAFVTWLAPLLGGETVGKILMLVGLTVAFVGMYRFTTSILASTASPVILALGAASIYAFGPFLVTRVAVGHLMVLWAMATLPWAAPRLLEAHGSGRRTFLWSLAFGVAGVYGAVICAALIIAGQVMARGRRAGVVVVAFILGQLVWLVPMVVVVLTAPPGVRSDASAFPADLRGIGAFGQLAAGQGFWSPAFQVGRGQASLALAGVVLAALAVLGSADFPRRYRVPLTVLAGISFVVSASSALAGLSSVALWLTSTALGAPFRETQRSLALFLFWMAPASALGGARLARRWRGGLAGLSAALPLVMALVLIGPGLWGAGGQLRPVTFGPDWVSARAEVRSHPGTMVALPWFEYYSSAMTAHRTVLNVMPYYFGGDVITASDPRVTGAAHQESLDPREATVSGLVDQVREGYPIGAQLADLGVRWIVLQHAIDWESYRGLVNDAGLEKVSDGVDLTLFRVRDWRGLAWSADGTPIGETGVVAPLRTLADSVPATRAAPFQTGWLQGGAVVSVAPGGLMELPGGSGTLWFWPSTVVLAADALVVGAAIMTLVTWPGRRRRRVKVDEVDTP